MLMHKSQQTQGQEVMCQMKLPYANWGMKYKITFVTTMQTRAVL